MIDTTKQKWDFSKEEKYAIAFLNEYGFSGDVVKQYIGKTVFTVCKDGLQDCFELPQGLKQKELKRRMEQFLRNWEQLEELATLRKEYIK